MSLEVQLAALTEAVKANTDVQTAILAKIGGTAVVNVTTEKPTEKAAPAEDKPKTRGRAAAAPKVKIPTVKEIQDKTTGFLDVEDDAEYEERAALVVQITEHFGVKKMSEITDEDRTKAMEMLDAAIAGDDPFAGEAQEEEKPKRRQLDV
jgi:hypothetical protein